MLTRRSHSQETNSINRANQPSRSTWRRLQTNSRIINYFKILPWGIWARPFTCSKYILLEENISKKNLPKGLYWQTNCWWSVQFSRLHSVLLDIMHCSSPVKSVGSSPSSQLENLNSVSSTHLNLFWCVDPPIQINLLHLLLHYLNLCMGWIKPSLVSKI